MDTQELVDTIRNASAPYRIILLDGARFTVSRESGRYTLTGITSEGRHSVGGEGETISVSPIRIINPSGPAECAEVSLYDSSHRRTFHISIDPGAVERVARAPGQPIYSRRTMPRSWAFSSIATRPRPISRTGSHTIPIGGPGGR